MKKRAGIFLLCFVIILLATICCGANFPDKEVTVRFDEKNVLHDSYSTTSGYILKVIFFYDNDYDKLCQIDFNGNYTLCLRNLYPQLYADILVYAERVRREAKEPSAIFSNGSFSYLDGENGREVDVEKLCQDVIKNMENGAVTEATFLPIKPQKTVDEVKNETKKIAEFSTSFSTSSANRRHNIALAARQLNNLVTLPGEKMSFNLAVGERSVENGFKEAKIIKDGEFIEGVGGGVCQVSTTLFNVWLKAGLGVVSSATHSLPVSYVKPSLDAMVSSATDLVLLNDSVCCVYLHARCVGDELVMTLYGKPCGYEIRLRSETKEVICAEYKVEEAEIADWQEGENERIVKEAVDGLVSESYRDYYKDGVFIRAEKLRKNTYKPQSGVKVLRKEEETP